MKYLFDILEGILLGLQITACFYCTLLVIKRVEKMGKDPKVKGYQEVLACGLILAVWIMLEPTGVPDRVSDMSWIGWVFLVATAILGAFNCYSLIGDDDK